MRITATDDSFRTQLDHNPENWALREVYAEFLESELNDEDMAFCQRWMAKYQRTADVWGNGLFGWWNVVKSLGTRTRVGPEDLPEHVWNGLTRYKPVYYYPGCGWKWYDSRREAEQALCRALKSLREERKL